MLITNHLFTDEAVSSFRSSRRRGNKANAFRVSGLPPSVHEKLFATPPHHGPLSNFEKLDSEELDQLWTRILAEDIYVEAYYEPAKDQDVRGANLPVGTKTKTLLKAMRLKIGTYNSVCSPTPKSQPLGFVHSR